MVGDGGEDGHNIIMWLNGEGTGDHIYVDEGGDVWCSTIKTPGQEGTGDTLGYVRGSRIYKY